jgi:hypothetical protein
VPAPEARHGLERAHDDVRGGADDVQDDQQRKPANRSSAGIRAGPPASWTSRSVPAVSGIALRATRAAGTGRLRWEPAGLVRRTVVVTVMTGAFVLVGLKAYGWSDKVG